MDGRQRAWLFPTMPEAFPRVRWRRVPTYVFARRGSIDHRRLGVQPRRRATLRFAERPDVALDG
jgi:hypothetical protein